MGPSSTILVCDASPPCARVLARQPGLEVVGLCSSGEEALESLPVLAPDLMIVGLDLRGMGGVATIREITRATHVPIVALPPGRADESMQATAALAAGALTTISQAHLRLDSPDGPAATALALRLRRLSTACVGRRPGVATPSGAPRLGGDAHARVIGNEEARPRRGSCQEVRGDAACGRMSASTASSWSGLLRRKPCTSSICPWRRWSSWSSVSTPSASVRRPRSRPS